MAEAVTLRSIMVNGHIGLKASEWPPFEYLGHPALII
jgi:hypothetical protein|nr:MAG TPA_asm: hypothetical protein [Caudoviricetes sp.]